MTTGRWGVNIEFKDQGVTTFKDVTSRLNSIRGQNPADPRSRFAIMLDGKVLSSPTSQAVISDGKSQITGNFTEDQAKALADQLKYGALPISFSIQSEQQISATLGSEQLKVGLLTGLIGLLLVFIYSLFQYRLLGFVTMASLIVAGIISYEAIVLLGWALNYRLSLAGVAGLIVAIGATADSFIVYFERIRDEIRAGRTIPSAVNHGWKRASPHHPRFEGREPAGGSGAVRGVGGFCEGLRLYPGLDCYRRPDRCIPVHSPHPDPAGEYPLLR